MNWEPLTTDWEIDAEVSPVELWSASGAQWLTDRRSGVPDRLVRGIVGVTDYLDQRGAVLGSGLEDRGLGVLSERAALLSMRPAGSVSCGGATRFLPTVDGWVAVTMARSDDIDAIPAWLGVEADAVSCWSVIAREVARRRSFDVVEQAVLLGLPCSAVGEVSDRTPVYVRSLGQASARPLAGIVVANLAPLWAGPLAGDVLSRLGARVIKVESVGRPDGSRRAGPFFEVMNGRSESLTLDLRSEAGRRQLGRFLRQVDVVIEGSRPRAVEQMGIVAEDLVRVGPRLWVSITGHGRSEPHSMRVGFGDDAAAAGGLVGWVHGTPVFLGDALADPLAGLTSAAAVVQLVETGGRWMVDVALSRVAASMAPTGEPLHEALATAAVPGANRTGRPLPLGRDTDAIVEEFGL